MDQVKLKKYIKQISHDLAYGKSEPSFFEIVRRFEQLDEALPKLGYANLPSQEPLRFGQKPFLNFPYSDVDSIQERNGNTSALMFVYFFGLLGVNGPMPLAFTSFVFQRSHNHYDYTWQRFLDIINHRFLTYFYRAWSQNEASVSLDRAEKGLFDYIVRGLAGLPKALLDGMSDEQSKAITGAVSYFRPLLKSKVGLEKMLSEYLDRPVLVKDMVLNSYKIPERYLAKLGNKETSTLGVNIQLGKRYYSISKKIEIEIGPIDLKEYQMFLPESELFNSLCYLISSYCNSIIYFDFVISIKSDTINKNKLGNYDIELGHNLWIGNPPKENPVVRLEASRIFTEARKKTFKKTNEREY